MSTHRDSLLIQPNPSYPSLQKHHRRPAHRSNSSLVLKKKVVWGNILAYGNYSRGRNAICSHSLMPYDCVPWVERRLGGMSTPEAAAGKSHRKWKFHKDLVRVMVLTDIKAHPVWTSDGVKQGSCGSGPPYSRNERMEQTLGGIHLPRISA